ncbi:RNA-binding S4 domain-containing protein [Peptostreptococcaceae bacterium AGR-M142]|jgi:ribosome-associated protein|nr:RNA-binding S4 domain-containing protein [Peptostreptococcaceae bacterium]
MEIKIKTEFIKLDSLLKFAEVVSSGGEAKVMILDEMVRLNGKITTQRGKKIRPGDIVKVEGLDEEIKVI